MPCFIKGQVGSVSSSYKSIKQCPEHMRLTRWLPRMANQPLESILRLNAIGNLFRMARTQSHVLNWKQMLRTYLSHRTLHSFRTKTKLVSWRPFVLKRALLGLWLWNISFLPFKYYIGCHKDPIVIQGCQARSALRLMEAVVELELE